VLVICEILFARGLPGVVDLVWQGRRLAAVPLLVDSFLLRFQFPAGFVAHNTQVDHSRRSNRLPRLGRFLFL